MKHRAVSAEKNSTVRPDHSSARPSQRPATTRPAAPRKPHGAPHGNPTREIGGERQTLSPPRDEQQRSVPRVDPGSDEGREVGRVPSALITLVNPACFGTPRGSGTHCQHRNRVIWSGQGSTALPLARSTAVICSAGGNWTGVGLISRKGATIGLNPIAATRVAVSLAPGSGRVIRTPSRLPSSPGLSGGPIAALRGDRLPVRWPGMTSGAGVIAVGRSRSNEPRCPRARPVRAPNSAQRIGPGKPRKVVLPPRAASGQIPRTLKMPERRHRARPVRAPVHVRHQSRRQPGRRNGLLVFWRVLSRLRKS